MHKRARKAYLLTYGILWRYLKLYLISKIFGKSYWNKRINRLHLRSANKIKKGLLELNGLFIKVGQLISILSNILPQEFREPLISLQNNIPPHKYEEIKKTIEQEFGESIEKTFSSFDKTPLAAASIGQTHRATLRTGEQVVVKVQYSDIKSIAEIDLAVIKNLVKMISFFFKIKGMDYMYSQVRIMIEEELDYIHEAQSMQIIGENLLHVKGITVPKLFPKYSGKKVITSSFCEGVNISNIKQLDEWNIDRPALSKRFIEMYCKMIFEDDIFHADPHPGNILVNQEGELILLDFGAVTRLSPEIKKGIPEMILAFTKNDTEAIVMSLRKMGFIGSGKDAYKLAEKLINIGQDFLQNEIKIDSLNLDGITIDPNSKIISKLLKSINMKEIGSTFQIPKDWILVQRVLVLVLGTSNELDPKSNPIDVIKPYVKKMATGNIGNISSVIVDSIKSQAVTIFSLPREMKNVLQKANNGGIEINTEELSKSNDGIANAIQQLVFVTIAIAALYFSTIDELSWNEYLKWLSILSFGMFLRYFFKRS